MAGKIILLNGASSSGKSTLAQALQARLDEPFWHFSIDHLVAGGVLPRPYVDRGAYREGDLRSRFFDGFHRCLPALAGAGNNLVVEHIVEREDWLPRLLRLLGDLDVYFVGVHCPLPELERRERARGDRRAGEARADFATVHAWCSYDFEVDATGPPERNAETLVAAWKARQRPSAFDRMARQSAPA